MMVFHTVNMKILICMLVFSLSLSTTLSGDASPQGYQQLGLNYYKFHGELAPTWERARQVCVEEGAHLAVLNSEEEARVLSEMFAAANVTSGAQYLVVAYIGFHDIFAEGVYITILDQPLNETGFQRWVFNEPSDSDPGSVTIGEDCGGINREDGGLHDVKCNVALPFICERV